MDKLITALGPNDPDDGEQGRQQRGLAIAVLEQNIRPDKFGYKVPSQSGNGIYLVNLEHGPYCTCPDFEKRVLSVKILENQLNRDEVSQAGQGGQPAFHGPSGFSLSPFGIR